MLRCSWRSPCYFCVASSAPIFLISSPHSADTTSLTGWENKYLTARVSQETIFPAGSRHIVLCPNSVVELRKTSVVLASPFEGSTELPFDRCILATGAQQSEPFRPAPGSTLEDYKTFLRKMQSDIKAASSVLVVGGGTVGVEIAGEIDSAYPDKKLSVVHSETGLLHPDATPAEAGVFTFPTTQTRVGDSLSSQLAERNVKVYLNDRAILTPDQRGALPKTETIKLASGASVDADYVLVAVGNSPNSGLAVKADPHAVTANGYIKVDSVFRVVPGDSASILAGEYYALGDVAAIAAWRTLVSAGAEAPALANIVAAEIKGKKPKAYAPPAVGAVVVTLGTKGGAGQIPLPLFGAVGAPGFVLGMKSKDFFAGKSFDGRFKGAQKVSTAA